MRTQQSATVVTYPIVTALVKAEDMLGKNRSWEPINETQARFLTEFFQMCRDEGRGIREIESIASWSAEDINNFLRQRGFAIQLAPFDARTFGIASVLDLLVEWLEKGGKTKVKCVTDRQWYDAARLKDGVGYYQSSIYRHPIAAIATKSGDVVSMTKVDRVPKGFDLVGMAEQLSSLSRPVNEFGGLIFPMVDLNQQVDVNWILNMRTDTDGGRKAYVSQAVQQTMLKMNEEGAHVKSAFAGSVTQVSFKVPKPDMVIDAPFLVWFTRQHLKKPLFVGYIATDDWKNPGSIR